MVIIVYVVVVMITAINNDGQIEQIGAFKTLTAKINDFNSCLRCVSISTKCRKGKVYSMKR